MTFLTEILEVKKEEVKKLKQRYSLASFHDEAYFNEPVKSLKSALRDKTGLAIVAEIKKASPSKGIIRHDFNHMRIAGVYMEAGVDAISVLTDRIFFQGNINFLQEIAKIKSVPLLRKDFIIDEYQVFEAKAFGADAVLLISEALSENQIKDLTAAAKECNLEVLLELHSHGEIKKIDFIRNDLIGINNRDLSTFTVDLDTTLKLAGRISPGTLLISESGIDSAGSINLLRSSGIKGVLIGEYFMKSKSIRDKVHEFKEWCENEG